MPVGNDFLDYLPKRDFEALAPHLTRLDLKRNDLIVKAGGHIRTAIFPTHSIISVIVELRNGAQVESRTLGKEGGFGLLHALNGTLSFETVTVQVSGEAYGIDRAPFVVAAEQSSSLREHIVRHAQATLVQTTQGVACNALHNVTQRFCRWLLMTQDRLESDEVPLTQHHLAIMLGVQRTTVAGVSSELQKRGRIRVRRGRIFILDRKAIQQECCECYRSLNNYVGALMDEYRDR